jgi:hypothetical protein
MENTSRHARFEIEEQKLGRSCHFPGLFLLLEKSTLAENTPWKSQLPGSVEAELMD